VDGKAVLSVKCSTAREFAIRAFAILTKWFSLTSKREVVMTARHYDEEFWTPTVFESLWISVLAAAVIGGFMVGLTALAH
jgi:hypothetical protein